MFCIILLKCAPIIRPIVTHECCHLIMMQVLLTQNNTIWAPDATINRMRHLSFQCFVLMMEWRFLYHVPARCLLIGWFCHVLTGTWRPAAQLRSLWGSSPVERCAPRHEGVREPRAQASPYPHSEQPREWRGGWMVKMARKDNQWERQRQKQRHRG